MKGGRASHSGCATGTWAGLASSFMHGWHNSERQSITAAACKTCAHTRLDCKMRPCRLTRMPVGK